MLTVEPCAIPEVLVVAPKRFGDSRGFFSETFNARAFAEATGITEPFVQDNHSLSAERGTIRGLHFQTPPHAQGKLVRVSRGAVLDVAVDIRVGSPTYGRHVAVEITSENWLQVWVPPGFAHGFCTLEPDTEVQYKVTGYYAPDNDCGLAYDDPEIGIDWPVDVSRAVLSQKDRGHPRLAELAEHFRFEG